MPAKRVVGYLAVVLFEFTWLQAVAGAPERVGTRGSFAPAVPSMSLANLRHTQPACCKSAPATTSLCAVASHVEVLRHLHASGAALRREDPRTNRPDARTALQTGTSAIVTATASPTRVHTDRAYAVVHPVHPVQFSHLDNRTLSDRERFPHGQGLVVLFQAPSGSPLSKVA